MNKTSSADALVEKISDRNRLVAILVRNEFRRPGVHFFTSGDLSQQLAHISHSAGTVIQAHIHNRVVREVSLTQEVLIIKKGRLRVDFYGNDLKYLESRILCAGDTILLVSGGHGFQVLDPVEIIEVKQGPYLGDQDKKCFAGISGTEARWERE